MGTKTISIKYLALIFMLRRTTQKPATAGTVSDATLLAPPGPGRDCVRRRWIAGVTVTAITLVTLAAVPPSEADKQAAIPSYAVSLAGGSLKPKGRWGVWVFGRRARRCWGTKIVERGLSNETAYCGYSVPRQPQQLAARGTFTTDKGRKSMLFFLTRRNVALLKVWIERPAGGRDLVRIRARPISEDRAHRAHMHPSFGYGAATFGGKLGCIKRVGAWTRSGMQVGASRLASCKH
jgi:hypothetical protein